ncbi:MAG TPA: S41 family peptidase [Thermoanaerobaculia bacterium]|nr:S41 family peptidase [Thermoanaerobaculia bacterium]
MKRALALLALTLAPLAAALPRDPAVSRTHVAFVEAGQLWLVPREGGAATRITDVAGNKSSPRFSPDGTRLAFSSGDLFTVAVRGGAPQRVTYFPGEAVLTQWTGDDRLLFYTSAESFSSIEMQLFTVSPRGGLPVRMPLVHGSEGALDPTGAWLAYTPQWPNPLIANWKRYRGGSASDVWLLNLRTRASRKLTEWAGVDRRPMWSGDALYYLSDDGAEQRVNLWRYDTKSGTRRQVTHFADYDVRNASMGPGAIVFEHGPDLRLLDLQSERSSAIRITTPEPELVREIDASRFITSTTSAGGTTLLEARGDLWIATGGAAPRNLTATSGAFEREAVLRPDGRAVAYWSDVTGEYQLYIRELDEPAPPAPLTNYANGFRYRPVWSPDGKRLAFAEQTGAIVIYDIAARRATEADREPRTSGAEPIELAWSADSSWLAYSKSAANRLGVIWRYDVASGTRQPLTSELFNASTPVFDANGEHLFFISYRNFGNLVSDWMQGRLTHRALTTLMAVPLRGNTLDLASIERTAKRLPITAGSIVALAVTPEGHPTYGLVDLGGKRSVRTFDVRTRSESIVAEGTSEIAQPKVDTSSMKTRVDLRAEWRQLFDDAWREYRDFFFAPKIALADWALVQRRYAPLLERCRSREEVNLVLAEMIGESSAGHAYLGNRGDVAPPRPRDAATLAADFVLDRGAFRIAHIVRAAPWDDELRSPLRDAVEGEYLLAIDGKPLDPAHDPRAALVGLAGKEVQLTIGPHPTLDATARVITVTPLSSENELRQRAWVEANRRRVEEASGGRIGYVHIPAFNQSGFSELARQYYGQVAKDALLIDARWSQGGSTGVIVAELLARRPLNAYATRYSDEPATAPPYGAHFGPKALLVNHITISAGENFAFYFRKLALGPLVGSRTWGGFTGLNPVPALIDGGAVNVPNAPFFDETGWMAEGEGLVPDIAVTRDPAAEPDAQLEAAVQALLARLPAARGSRFGFVPTQ